MDKTIRISKKCSISGSLFSGKSQKMAGLSQDSLKKLPEFGCFIQKIACDL
jgi:hypothetical protein